MTGIDSSGDMLAAARQRLPQQRFEQGDIARWTPPAPVDLILANASLQWVPDHAALLPQLLQHLAPGGTLAFQIPDNLDEPAHRAMRRVAETGPWADRLRPALGRSAHRHDALTYARLLGPGADIWRTVYHHRIPGGLDGVVDWFLGSALRPLLAPLKAAEQAEFLQRYRHALDGAYPGLGDGSVLLPFPRLFVCMHQR